MQLKRAAATRQEANKPESIGAALSGVTPMWNALKPWEKRKARRLLRDFVRQMPSDVRHAFSEAISAI